MQTRIGPAAHVHGSSTHALRHHRWWPFAKRVLPLLFLIIIAALLASRARAIDWPAVWAALAAYRAPTLWAAALFALASFGVYSCFDLVSRAYTGHRLRNLRVMSIAAISYAFNLNFGTLIGGMGFRFRLYTHAGLYAGTVARVLALSVATNWLGYMTLAGVFMSLKRVPLPADWDTGAVVMRALGPVFLAIPAVYLWLCAFSRRRSWKFRRYDLRLPSLRIAGAQLLVSCINWFLISALVFTLMRPYGAAFVDVMGALLMSAVAGLIVRVPAGLGVVEAVFISLLEGRLSEVNIVAALLAYRAIYYLLPLLIALCAYVTLEIAYRRRRAGAP